MPPRIPSCDRPPAGTHHLAWWSGDPVALVALVPTDSRGSTHGQLTSMWIAPEHRGTGLGERLVSASCEQGRVRGVRVVTLWVVDGNEAAERLYERCGFVLTGRRQPVREDEPGRAEQEMRRIIVGSGETRGRGRGDPAGR